MVCGIRLHLLEKGIDVRYIKELLGHFPIRRYLHVRNDSLIKIVSPVRQFMPRLSLVVAFNHQNCHICSATAPSLLARFVMKNNFEGASKQEITTGGQIL